MHTLAGYERPGDEALVSNITGACAREAAKPVVRKSPVAKDHICRIVQHYCRDTADINDFRTGTMLMLMYYGFLRFGELAALRMKDLTFFSDRAQVLIRQSKTDKLRQGETIPIVRGYRGSYCPVNILERYVQLAFPQPELDSETPLFFKLNPRAPGSPPLPITYTLAREIASKAFGFLGLPSGSFSLHSLRSGGATAAAASGLDGRLIQRHGRWKTSYSRDRYIEDTMKDRLDVSRHL